MNPAIALMIRASHRSWWQARYFGGKVLSEWDTVIDLVRPKGSTSRWEEVPKKNMTALRLLCPNGQAAELETTDDSGHKFFQLKSGVLSVGVPAPVCHAHIIGVVYNSDGDCRCLCWDTRAQKIVEFEDNVLNFRFDGIGRLNLDAQDLRF